MTHFPVELRTASVVTRWGIIRTHGKDTVAGHSYYVAMYAQEIAKLIGWHSTSGLKVYYENMFYLLQLALAHDLDEVFTGDTVTFVKPEITDKDRAAKYVSHKMLECMPGTANTLNEIAALPYADEIKAIVKAADWLDALFFSYDEQRMGNGVITKYTPFTLDRLQEAWFKLPCDSARLSELWMNDMRDAINQHREGLDR